MYRLFRCCDKLPLKIMHGVIQASSIVFAGVGLKAAFDFHNRSDLENMYSMHSWLGLITVIVFGIQVCFASAQVYSEYYKYCM